MSKSKPVFEGVFAFEGRRNRRSYVLIQITSFVAMAAAATLGVAGVALYGDGGAVAVAASAFIVTAIGVFVAAFVAAWATSAQRVRDIGHPGPWCLIQAVPYVGWVAALFIIFTAGDTRVANRFGNSCIAERA